MPTVAKTLAIVPTSATLGSRSGTKRARSRSTHQQPQASVAQHMDSIHVRWRRRAEVPWARSER
jgi:hypothetical protein